MTPRIILSQYRVVPLNRQPVRCALSSHSASRSITRWTTTTATTLGANLDVIAAARDVVRGDAPDDAWVACLLTYLPGLPRYAVRTQRQWGPGGKPPCASGTYPTREAGTRSPYVPCGGPGAYVSAQHDAVVLTRFDQPSERRAAACGKGS